MARRTATVGQAKSKHQFLVLHDTRFAYAAMNSMREQDPRNKTPLLYLSGPSGVGKSHLIRNLICEATIANRSLNYKHQTAGSFLDRFQALLDENRLFEFHDEQVHTDLFIFEDVHLLETHKTAQRQFLSILDALSSKGSRVIITSRHPAGEIRGFNSKLVNRLHGGITASIPLPDEMSRLQLLFHFCESLLLLIRGDAAELIAREMTVSPRELLASVQQLHILGGLEGRSIDLAIAKRFLNHETFTPKPTIAEVAKEVAKEFKVSLKELRSKARDHRVLIPRQIAIFLSRELTDSRLSDLGSYFGGRNHSTILHALQKIETTLSKSPSLEYQICSIRRRLQGVPNKPR